MDTSRGRITQKEKKMLTSAKACTVKHIRTALNPTQILELQRYVACVQIIPAFQQKLSKSNEL